MTNNDAICYLQLIYFKQSCNGFTAPEVPLLNGTQLCINHMAAMRNVMLFHHFIVATYSTGE